MTTIDLSSAVETNWAGNHRYRARRIEHPRTVEQVQHLVAAEPRVRALGSRHSFTDITDTDGVLVSLADLPTTVEVDAGSRTARVTGLAAYGDVARALQAQGWALPNLASLPHISVAGAVATGTHGSGDRNGSLATAVAALEVVRPDGSLVRIARGEPDFDGSVVSLGALGVVVALTLDVEPTYTVNQRVFTGLGWDTVVEHYDAITASAYSVSLFTHWGDGGVEQVWLKSRGDDGPADFHDALPAGATMHMLDGGDTRAVSAQLGEPGPWLDRLTHFRMEFTPSRGEELQSEYLVPRDRAVEAIEVMRGLGERIAPLLQVCELRTVAADDLWLSSSYGTDVTAFHFTWNRDVDGVYAVLPAIEEGLLPLGARPHWGKCFAADAGALAPLYPRFGDFLALRDRVDPDRVFGNTFLDRVLG
ncbi:FAD-binding protein [Terracoccus luteus]|uniref:Xylitol oxidase n=1 Tax=Terracoccus luteus TaxID=53356 RepID=A0A495XW08_9MICO|nr:FAD-binding protein [Terracoccus luteus]MBB2986876.1 xylitol oxidase [Terracoccus luteus]MCP2172527.1 xylitol oxidase [Terracoccus luteus]RKT76926.1 xylitol oxidase [Terracoccus luteus]